MRIDLCAAALFLDLDGVLAPIAPTPDAVGPDPARRARLSRAEAALGGRVAVLSGRAVADLDRILEGAPAAVAGLHGLERRRAGGPVLRAPAPPGLPAARAAAAAFAADRPGLLVEDKGLAVALHHRLAPDLGPALADFAAGLAAASGLVLQPGSMVFELRAPGPDKGDALRAFMAEPPFAGAVPLFVGDDLTDEHGFAAAADLGGAGVLVGPPRPTRAAAGLSDPAAVAGWIDAALARGAFILEPAPWAA
jgi:trehalose 6-phosphate phosphatase